MTGEYFQRHAISLDLRMKFLNRLILAAGAVALMAGINTSTIADVTVTSWGGAYTASQQKA